MRAILRQTWVVSLPGQGAEGLAMVRKLWGGLEPLTHVRGGGLAFRAINLNEIGLRVLHMALAASTAYAALGLTPLA